MKLLEGGILIYAAERVVRASDPHGRTDGYLLGAARQGASKRGAVCEGGEDMAGPPYPARSAGSVWRREEGREGGYAGGMPAGRDPVFARWVEIAKAIDKCQRAARRGLAAESTGEKRQALREAERWEKEVARLERSWQQRRNTASTPTAGSAESGSTSRRSTSSGAGGRRRTR